MKIFNTLQILVKSRGFKSAGIYTFSNFFAKATGFLLLFLYSNPKYISVDENGLLSLLGSSVYILMPLLSLGIIQSTSVDYFKLDKNELRDFFTSGFVMPAITMIVACAGLYFFRNEINFHFGFPLSFVLIIPVLSFLNFCNEQYISLIRNNDEPVIFFKASMLRLFLEISISVTLVVAFAWRWEGRVTGILIANGVLLIVAFIYFFRKGYVFGRIRKKYLTQELTYALPIIVMQVSTFCMAHSDKFFVAYFSDNNSVGIYGYACIFASLISVACSAMLSYVMPKIYAAMAKPAIDFNAIRKYFYYYAAGCSAVLLVVVFITPLMYKLFINELYHPGLQYMFLIAIGYFLWSITYFFYSFLLFKKQKIVILILSLISITISLSFNYLFTSNWQTQGAALAICFSYLAVLIITLLISYKNVRILFSKNNHSLNR